MKIRSKSAIFMTNLEVSLEGKSIDGYRRCLSY